MAVKSKKKSVSLADVGAAPTRASRADEMRWSAEDALATITRAEEHKKNPELMRHVRKIAKQKMSSLSAVARAAEE